MQRQAPEETDQAAPLIAVLKEVYGENGEISTRNDAVIALSDDLISLGEQAVEPLLQALSDPALRFFAICTLGHLGDRRATEPLLALLAQQRAEGSEDILYLIKALGRIGDERAVTALSDLLTAAEHHPFKAVPSPSILHSDLFEVFSAWLFRRQRGVALARHEEYVHRHLPLYLIQALGNIGGSRAVEAIRTRLTDPDAVLRAAALRVVDQLDTGVHGERAPGKTTEE